MSSTINGEFFWKKPAHPSFVHPPLDDRSIGEAERLLGVTLPREYTDLLRVQNGGYVKYCTYDADRSPDQLFGIGSRAPNVCEETRKMREAYEGILGSDRLVVLDFELESFLCLDYRKDPVTPGVVSVEFDSEEETEIATSFGDYLRNWGIPISSFWYPNCFFRPDREGIHPREVEAALRLSLTNGGSLHRGYDVYKNEADTVRAYPNKVPQWYDNLERPATVAPTTDAHALLYDMMPDHAWIISTNSPDLCNQLTPRLSAAGYHIRDLDAVANQFRITFVPG